MDKREFFCLLLAAFFATGICANAQSSSSAYQRIELHIQPSIEIASLKASEVQLSVKNDKKSKTLAAGHEFRIRSNKNFVVKVSAQQPEEGMDEMNTPAMQSLKNDLQLAVATDIEKNTANNNYTSVSDSPKDIITKGRRGEQIFAVNYQVKRAGKYNNGHHAVGVVYTATEP